MPADKDEGVQKCIECFAVIIQGRRNDNYSAELLDMGACLEKTWRSYLKKSQAGSLIPELSSRPSRMCSLKPPNCHRSNN